jgi:hypothetical protein
VVVAVGQELSLVFLEKLELQVVLVEVDQKLRVLMLQDLEGREIHHQYHHRKEIMVDQVEHIPQVLEVEVVPEALDHLLLEVLVV